MTVSLLALLLGLFAVPCVLLWMGHRLRRRSSAWRAVFWGAVIGYVVGTIVTLAAMHYPPVPWGGGGWRTALVHWGMLAGGIAGAGAGWVTGGRRG